MEANTAFIEAAKMKLRFPFRGLATVEDLFDLTREQLSDLYQSFSTAAKLDDGDSLIQRRKEDSTDTLRRLSMVVVKTVFDIKSDAANEARKSADKKKRNEKIMEIIARKQDASLEDKSMDELQALLAE